MAMGKVWLVGAGPSDVGLLTLKGLHVLERAQVVVYDHLVGQEILMRIPEDAVAIDVGKQAGNHKKAQEEINQILLENALKGLRVVRLKGGDPFLFGRGGEELELLVEHGVPFEVVPGVTSALAVPAYNGIPVTHRDFASSLHIITGHKRQNKPLSVDFEALVRTGGTLVFLMGVKSLPDIVKGLMDAGMPGDMPAAVLQEGTTAGQRRVLAPLVQLEDRVAEAGIGTPAIIVVGKVCGLSDRFSWYEKQPLAGETIVITRPRDRASKLAEQLRDLGAETICLPAIETVPVEDEKSVKRVRETFSQLTQYDLLVFTSPYGVICFFEWMRENRQDIRKLAGKKLAAIGTATARALEERGFLVDLVPDVYNGGELGKAIGRQFDMKTRILIPRAREGSRDLTEELCRAGFTHVTDLPIYETRKKDREMVGLRERFDKGQVSWVMFTSASTVDGFAKQLPGLDYSRLRALCIGPQTERAARDLGMRTKVSEEATVDSMVRFLLKQGS